MREATRRARGRCPAIGTSASGFGAEEDGARGPGGESGIRGGGMFTAAGEKGATDRELAVPSRLPLPWGGETDVMAAKSGL